MVLIPEEIHHFDFGVLVNVNRLVHSILHMLQPSLRSFMSHRKWTVTTNQGRMTYTQRSIATK